MSDLSESGDPTPGNGETLSRGAAAHAALETRVAAAVARFRRATEEQLVAARAELTVLLQGDAGEAVRGIVEKVMRGELLEVQWEVEEVLDATAPAAAPSELEPEPEPEPEPEEEPERPLTAADLSPVYEDPRGLVLYKTKVGDRWFATQVDPRTGQPQTFELRSHEVSQLRMQLQGSPHWRVDPATTM